MEIPIIAVKNQKQDKTRKPQSNCNIVIEILANAMRHNSEIKGMLFWQVIESLFVIVCFLLKHLEKLGEKGLSLIK